MNMDLTLSSFSFETSDVSVVIAVWGNSVIDVEQDKGVIWAIFLMKEGRFQCCYSEMQGGNLSTRKSRYLYADSLSSLRKAAPRFCQSLLDGHITTGTLLLLIFFSCSYYYFVRSLSGSKFSSLIMCSKYPTHFFSIFVFPSHAVQGSVLKPR